MGFLPKRLTLQNLDEASVYIEDTNNEYFNVQEVPETLTQGRYAFKIFGSDLLREGVELKIELLDAEGNTIFLTPVDFIGEEVPPYVPYRYITIEVYSPPINVPGLATLTILGELNPDVVNVPSEFQNAYNVRYQETLNVDLSTAINTQPIRFFKNPTTDHQEVVQAKTILAPISESIVTATVDGISRSDLKGRIIQIESGSLEKESLPKEISDTFQDLRRFKDEYKYKTGLRGNSPAIIKRRGLSTIFASKEEPKFKLRSKVGIFKADMQGGTVEIPERTVTIKKLDSITNRLITEEVTVPRYKSKILEVIDENTIIPEKPPLVTLPTGSNPAGTDITEVTIEDFSETALTASFNNTSVSVLQSGIQFDSMLDLTIKNMRTFSGDIYRVRVHGKSESAKSDFTVLADTIVESPELLKDSDSSSGTLRTGYFLNQNHINVYWNSSSFDGSTRGGNVSAFHTGSHFIDSLRISGSTSGQDESIVVETNSNNYFTLRKNSVYTISAKVKGITTSKVIDGNIRKAGKLYFHLSGSNLNTSNEFNSHAYFGAELSDSDGGQPVVLQLDDDIEGIQNFETVDHTFTPKFNLDRTANVDTILQIRAESGEWFISDLSLRPAMDTGFSPDEFKVKVPIPRTQRPDRFDFLIEYFDINNNVAETVTIVQDVAISGSAFIIDGSDNLLTGSLFMGNAAGSGIEAAGINSAFVRSVGYEGFQSASLGGQGGFMIFSGSVLPDAPDSYEGAGIEIHDGVEGVDESYLKFRTKPSLFDVKTSTFFLGKTHSPANFISGSNGNLEISSSNFELTADGDVSMSGEITATGGTLGGFTIASTKISTTGVEIGNSDEDLFISSSAFKVDHFGNITASNIDLGGTISATSGDIGGWIIEDGQLSSGIGNSSVSLSADLQIISMGTGSTFNKGDLGGGLRMGIDTDGVFKFAVGSAASYLYADASGVSIKTDSFDVTASVAEIDVDVFKLSATQLFISSSQGGFIRMGSTLPTDITGTNKGIYMQGSNNHFLVGNAAGGHLKFDGTNTSISSSDFYLGNDTNFVSGSSGNIKIFSTGDTTLSGSSVTLATPKFYLGSTAQFISGSDGNIEISSSNFHVSSSGEVNMLGTITATAGAIGGFTIDADEIKSGTTLILDSDSNSGEIKLGAATDIDTGDGIYMNGTGNAFRVGNPAGNEFKFDGTSVFIGNDGAEHVKIDGTSLRFIEDSTTMAELRGTTWTLGGAHGATDDAIVMSPTNGVTIFDSSTNKAVISALGLDITQNNVNVARFAAVSRLGDVANEHISMSAAGMTIKDGTTVLANFAADVTIGEVASNKRNVFIDENVGIKVRNNTTDIASFGDNVTLAGGTITIQGTTGTLGDDRLVIGSANIEMYTNDAKVVDIVDGKISIGPAANAGATDGAVIGNIHLASGGAFIYGAATDDFVNVKSDGVDVVAAGVTQATFGATTVIGTSTDKVTLSSSGITIKENNADTITMASGVITVGSSTDKVTINGTSGISIKENNADTITMINGVVTIGSSTDKVTINGTSGITIKENNKDNISLVNGTIKVGVDEDDSTFLQIDSDSIDIIEDVGGTNTTVASFGLATVIGPIADDKSRIELGSGKVEIINRQGSTDTTVISLDADGDATFTGTVTATAGAIGGWVLGTNTIVGSNLTLRDSGQIETNDFASGVKGFRLDSAGNGSAEFENVRIRGTLSTTVFEKELVSAVGGQLYVANSSVLTGSLTISASATTMSIENVSGFTGSYGGDGEILTAKKITSTGFSTEYIFVQSASRNDQSSDTDFSGELFVIRGYSGSIETKSGSVGDTASPAQTYSPGQVFASTGRVGTGYIRLNANPNDQTTPYMDIVERTGSGVYDVDLKVRIGDLSGLSTSRLHGTDPATAGFGLYGQNVFLEGGIVANTGSIAGIKMESGKLFIGTGTHGNDNTGFFANSDGDFSLGNAFVWDAGDKTLAVSGSSVDITTQKFFLGSGAQFISGSEGNIEISSSKFHLERTGDVTMQGTITATAGAIGGFTIDADEIKSGTTLILDSDTNNGEIKLGAATSLIVGDGIYMNGSGHFRAGNAVGQGVKFDGTNVILSSSAFILGNDTNFISGSTGNLKIFSTGDTTLSGSSVTIATPKFYLGSTGQYISGSEGNIEISSSKFHLERTGDVTMQGTITATAGAIGGFTIDADEIKSTNLLLDSSNEKITVGSANAVTIQGGGTDNFITMGKTTFGQATTVGAILGMDAAVPTLELFKDANNSFIFNNSGLDIKTDTLVASGSSIRLEASQFYLGQSSQFISGSSGNIEISSSNFHLQPDGDVIMSGKVTATSGEIGGFLINSSAISSSDGSLVLNADGGITGSKFLLSGGIITDDVTIEGSLSANSISTPTGGSPKAIITDKGFASFVSASIGGFAISNTSISDADGDLVLNSEGQITASSALITGNININAGSAKLQLDSLGEETASLKEASASLQLASTASFTAITAVGASSVVSASAYGDGAVASGSLFAANAEATASLLGASAAASASADSSSLSSRIMTDIRGSVLDVPDSPAGDGLFLNYPYVGFYGKPTITDTTYVVTANGNSNYIIDGDAQPTLTLQVGYTYRFDTSAVGSHPFRFSTTSNGSHGGGSVYSTGVTVGSGYVDIEVTSSTASTLYYYCTNHGGMGGQVNVVDNSEFKAFISASGGFLFKADDNNLISFGQSVSGGDGVDSKSFVLKADNVFMSGSKINMLSDKFFLGGDSTFVSGSGGNIEISSSRFHLQPDGDVVMNDITASNARFSGHITINAGPAADTLDSIAAETGSLKEASASLQLASTASFTAITAVGASAIVSASAYGDGAVASGSLFALSAFASSSAASASLVATRTAISASTVARIMTDASGKIVETPSSTGLTGLQLKSTHLGYADDGTFNAFIGSSGNFLFKNDANNLISFGQSATGGDGASSTNFVLRAQNVFMSGSSVNMLTDKFFFGNDSTFISGSEGNITVSGSSIELLTPKFYFGEAGQYISGSEGNIEISSSMFHLDPQNNKVSISGSITATDGTIGGMRIDQSKIESVADAGDGSTTTFIVTANGNSNYIIDGVNQPTLTFIPGNIYKFDVSDDSNSGHPLRFTESDGGTDYYTTGLATNGSAGSSGAYVQLTVTQNTPNPLYYRCTNHSAMRNSITVDKTSPLVLDGNTGQISGSRVLFDGGVIGGFEIGSTQINDSDDNLILKSSGQISASAIQLTGEVNIIGGSAKDTIDLISAETGSLQTGITNSEATSSLIGASSVSSASAYGDGAVASGSLFASNAEATSSLLGASSFASSSAQSASLAAPIAKTLIDSGSIASAVQLTTTGLNILNSDSDAIAQYSADATIGRTATGLSNVFIDSSEAEVQIRKGTQVSASFGANTTIGSDIGKHIKINSTALEIKTSANNTVLSASAAGLEMSGSIIAASGRISNFSITSGSIDSNVGNAKRGLKLEPGDSIRGYGTEVHSTTSAPGLFSFGIRTVAPPVGTSAGFTSTADLLTDNNTTDFATE